MKGLDNSEKQQKERPFFFIIGCVPNELEHRLQTHVPWSAIPQFATGGAVADTDEAGM